MSSRLPRPGGRAGEGEGTEQELGTRRTRCRVHHGAHGEQERVQAEAPVLWGLEQPGENAGLGDGPGAADENGVGYAAALGILWLQFTSPSRRPADTALSFLGSRLKTLRWRESRQLAQMSGSRELKGETRPGPLFPCFPVSMTRTEALCGLACRPRGFTLILPTNMSAKSGEESSPLPVGGSLPSGPLRGTPEQEAQAPGPRSWAPRRPQISAFTWLALWQPRLLSPAGFSCNDACNLELARYLLLFRVCVTNYSL